MKTFRDIKGYEGIYKISEFGDVVKYPETPVAQNINTTGYPRVNLWHPKEKRNAIEVHRLVAKTFLPDAPENTEVNHKDGNKLNNHFSNLEWVSHKANMEHAGAHKLFNDRRGVLNPKAKLIEENVRDIRKANSVKLDKYFAHKFNVSTSTIKVVRLGKQWRHVKED